MALGAVLLIGGGALGLEHVSGRNQASVPEQARLLEIEGVRVAFERGYSRQRVYTGVVEARRALDLGFRIGGLLREVVVTEGARVARGDALARLDTDALQARRSGIEAQLAGARAVLDELEEGPRRERIGAARARVASARATLSRLELDLDRVRRAFEGGAAVESERDGARFAVEAARADVDALSEELRELETGTRAERVEAQRAEVRRLEASLGEIDVDLEDSVLVAPFDGVLARHHADEGRVVGAGDAVVRLVEVGDLEAWIGVSRETGATINVGEGVDLDLRGAGVRGTVRGVMPELDPATRTVRVVVSIPDESGAVAGDIVRVGVSTWEEAEGFWLPVGALSEGRRGLWRAFELEPTDEVGVRRVGVVDVEVLYVDGERAFVRGAVRDGAVLVRSGVHRIDPGLRVRLSGEGGL